MKIYTFPRSRSLRVLWTLEELGVDYETVRVDMFSDKPKVKSPHSRGKVPLMLVDYFKIESENVTRQFKLNKDNEWVAGDNFTLADIFLSHTLLWARLCHVNLSPTINDYIDRAISRRSYIQAQEKNNL
ncbi:glutathione S-transferase [Providencia rettgeri]|uniref:glutathione S-transferase family protein n=1 Tax=Providencia TaxID=586 RepID=UPI0018E78738|nr:MULTISPECIES: glutathione S-transferase family protein [Providencia]QQE91421.1 glutathione S-transferase [Providencia rettgeri]QWJ89881.1 glutathione S-transferase N-terminal domain-containing protein [Providencia rettgeri]